MPYILNLSAILENSRNARLHISHVAQILFSLTHSFSLYFIIKKIVLRKFHEMLVQCNPESDQHGPNHGVCGEHESLRSTFINRPVLRQQWSTWPDWYCFSAKSLSGGYMVGLGGRSCSCVKVKQVENKRV